MIRPVVVAALLVGVLLVAAPAGAAAQASARDQARFLQGQVGPERGAARGRSDSGPKDQLGDGAPGRERQAPRGSGDGPLRLVRSFDIPEDDPAAKRLANLAFTYDTALAAAGLVSAGRKAEAAELLDQLVELQADDGSLAAAYDVRSGAADRSRRAGVVAWVALAASAYEGRWPEARYTALADRAMGFLLTLLEPDGLVRGGPDVRWVSTQHNLLTYFLLRRRAEQDPRNREALLGAAERMSAAIDAQLLRRTNQPHFIQGRDDAVIPLDAQTLGILYLHERGRGQDAENVAVAMLLRFYERDQSIARSRNPATFNETYEAKGPFTGLKPYGGADAPDLIWMEGVLQAATAMDRLPRPQGSFWNEPIAKWNAVTGAAVAPLMANKTQTDRFNEYHVWPVAATASWSLIRRDSRAVIPGPPAG